MWLIKFNISVWSNLYKSYTVLFTELNMSWKKTYRVLKGMPKHENYQRRCNSNKLFHHLSQKRSQAHAWSLTDTSSFKSSQKILGGRVTEMSLLEDKQGDKSKQMTVNEIWICNKDQEGFEYKLWIAGKFSVL